MFLSNFDRKTFGENLRRARKSKGLSLENIAKVINKDATTVGRYEKGEVVPNIEDICLICDELNIYEYELLGAKTKISNKDKNKNPFGVKNLYLYYKAFFPSTKKYGKGKFKLIIIEKPDSCEVNFVDYKTNKIYLTGYLLSDDNIAVFVFENYKPNSPRLEVSEIILNVSNGLNGLMIGTFYCTNGKYIPSIRKCVISKKDIEFNEEVMKLLKISETDKKELEDDDVLHIELENIEDFEKE